MHSTLMLYGLFVFYDLEDNATRCYFVSHLHAVNFTFAGTSIGIISNLGGRTETTFVLFQLPFDSSFKVTQAVCQMEISDEDKLVS